MIGSFLTHSQMTFRSYKRQWYLGSYDEDLGQLRGYLTWPGRLVSKVEQLSGKRRLLT